MYKSYSSLHPSEKAKLEKRGANDSAVEKNDYLTYNSSANFQKGQKMEPEKRKRGRPPKMTIQRYAENPPAVLAKTDHHRMRELKELMIRSGGKDVVEKVVEIALNDDHPGQMAALKMCIDRTLPVSMFEKDKSQRNAITINITGLGVEPVVIDQEDITDV